MTRIGMTEENIDASIQWLHQKLPAEGYTLVDGALNPEGASLRIDLINGIEPHAVKVHVDAKGQLVFLRSEAVISLNTEDKSRNSQRLCAAKLVTVLPDMKNPTKFSCETYLAEPPKPLPPAVLEAFQNIKS